MTRLRHRFASQRYGHLRLPPSVRIQHSAIKIIDGIINPYLEAFYAGNYNEIEKLFEPDTIESIINQLITLNTYREVHKEHVDMTINVIKALKFVYNCFKDNQNNQFQIDNLIDLNTELNQIINNSRISVRKAIPIEVSVNITGEIKWYHLVYHHFYGYPDSSGLYDYRLLSMIIAGTATGDETPSN